MVYPEGMGRPAVKLVGPLDRGYLYVEKTYLSSPKSSKWVCNEWASFLAGGGGEHRYCSTTPGGNGKRIIALN